MHLRRDAALRSAAAVLHSCIPMNSLLRTLLILFLLFLLNGWINSGQFRYLGDKTHFRLWYDTADLVDRLHDIIDRTVDDIKRSIQEEIERRDGEAGRGGPQRTW